MEDEMIHDPYNSQGEMNHQPQQIGIAIEMIRSMEGGRIAPLDIQRIMDATLTFGMSLIVMTIIGVMVRDFLRESLGPEKKERIKPVVDVMLPQTERSRTVPRVMTEKLYRVFRVRDGQLMFAGSQEDAMRKFHQLGGTKGGYRILVTTKDRLKDAMREIARQGAPLPLVIRCAWCGKHMGEKEPYEDKSETHGICPECMAKYFPDQPATVTPKSKLKIWDAVDREKLRQYCEQTYGVPVTAEASDYFARLMDRRIVDFKGYLPLHLINRRGLTAGDMHRAASRYFG